MNMLCWRGAGGGGEVQQGIKNYRVPRSRGWKQRGKGIPVFRISNSLVLGGGNQGDMSLALFTYC